MPDMCPTAHNWVIYDNDEDFYDDDDCDDNRQLCSTADIPTAWATLPKMTIRVFQRGGNDCQCTEWK